MALGPDNTLAVIVLVILGVYGIMKVVRLIGYAREEKKKKRGS